MLYLNRGGYNGLHGVYMGFRDSIPASVRLGVFKTKIIVAGVQQSGFSGFYFPPKV